MPSWAERIRSGDTRALARAATAIENRAAEAQPLLRELFPFTGNAALVGVTGPPGAGKSTVVNALITAIRATGKRAGVIAVDPTSPYSGGAILGDRIRMAGHHGDPGVFIRSVATRGCLGGLAAAATDLALLLDAAGLDFVLIETVGVGQDEVEIAKLSDVTVVVLVPGMGDDVQAIKAGILEIADIFLINKADQPGADRLQREIRGMQSLGRNGSGWTPPILHAVATTGEGIPALLEAIQTFRASAPTRNRSAAVWRDRLRGMLRDRLYDRLFDIDLDAAAVAVATRQSDPYSIIDNWVQSLHAGI